MPKENEPGISPWNLSGNPECKHCTRQLITGALERQQRRTPDALQPGKPPCPSAAFPGFIIAHWE